MKKYTELYYPMMLAVTGIILADFVNLPKGTPFYIFLGSVATVGSIMSSLTGVSTATILSLRKEEIGQELYDIGAYKDLMTYAYRSVLASLCLAIVALVGFFVADCTKFYKYVLFAIFFYSVGAFHRIFRLLCVIGGFQRKKQP